MFLIVIFNSVSSYAKSSTILSCVMDDSKTHVSVRLVNNKIEFAKYFDNNLKREVSIAKPKVVNSEKYFALSGQVDKKSLRLAVDLESQEVPNGNLTMAKGKPLEMNCSYSETGLNI